LNAEKTMTTDQLLCILVPLDAARAAAIQVELDRAMHERLDAALQRAGCFHFACIALLPAPGAAFGERHGPEMLIELAVDPGVTRRQAIERLVDHALRELWELLAPTLSAPAVADPNAAALVDWLYHRTKSAEGGYVGTPDRTVAQIHDEQRLFIAARQLGHQARQPLSTSAELARAVGRLAEPGTDHPVCRSPAPRSFWRRRTPLQRIVLVGLLLVVPGLLLAPLPLAMMAFFGLAALAAGGMVLDPVHVAAVSLGVTSMAPAYAAIVQVGGTALLVELMAGLVRLGALSVTAAVGLVFALGLLLIGSMFAVVLLSNTKPEFLGALLHMVAWGLGSALVTALVAFWVLLTGLLSLLLAPPYLGPRGLLASLVALLLPMALVLHFVLDGVLTAVHLLTHLKAIELLRRAPPLWGWLPAADAVVLLLVAFVVIGGLLLAWGAALTGPIKTLLQAVDTPRLHRTEAAQQSHPSIDANAAELRDRVNHMISVTDLQEGSSLRVVALRLVLWLVGLLGRTYFVDGLLGTARGIHFGHWHLIDGGRRLLFCSNYDGSFGGYLDEFISGASQGINLIWRWTELNPRLPAIAPQRGQMPQPGVQRFRRFPPTLLGIFRGCRHELWFKAFARDSMVPHLYRFEAYRCTNEDVDRATGLRDALHLRFVAEQQQQPTEVHDDRIMRAIES
jgi:hypothetical protein